MKAYFKDQYVTVCDYAIFNLNDRHANNKGLQLVCELEQLLIQGLQGNEEAFNRLL